jgi:hypothetical protein
VKQIAIAALALAAASCSNKPESSGTNTNWLAACTDAAECGQSSACLCALCTKPCSTDAECAPGVCGSALATSNQCGLAQAQPVCLPKPPNAGTCSEFPIPADADLALSAAAAPCDVPGALLCEAFDGPLPAEHSTWYSGAMTAAIEDCRVRGGSGAIRYQAAAFGYSQTRMRLATAVSSGPLFARFYAYVPASVTIPDYLGLFELWDADASSDGKISVELKPDDVLEIYLTPNGTTHSSARGALLRDQWMCITLALDVAAEGGSVSLSVNGTRVIDQSGVVTRPPNPISVAVVEGLPSEDGTNVDLSLDELVVGAQPISCP